MAIGPEGRNFSGQVSEAGQRSPSLPVLIHPGKEKELGEERGGEEGAELGGWGYMEGPVLS